MTHLITIFGGMLLTLALYGLARLFRLSNYWAAVLAAGLPSFAYLGYAVLVWPGLDVATLNVIAYLTVALLLYLLYGAKTGRRERLHWAPKLLIAFFVVITVIFGGFVYIAGQGVPPAVARWLLPGAAGKNVHTGFSGVVAHGGDAAKVIGHHMKMEAKLAKLGWAVEVVGLDALRPGQAEAVRVSIRDRDGAVVTDVRVRLGLGRPGQPIEQEVELPGAGDGSHRADIALPATGAWLATLMLDGRGEKIALERVVGGE